MIENLVFPKENQYFPGPKTAKPYKNCSFDKKNTNFTNFTNFTYFTSFSESPLPSRTQLQPTGERGPRKRGKIGKICKIGRIGIFLAETTVFIRFRGFWVWKTLVSLRKNKIFNDFS